jgi:hypothetical protein
MKLGAMIVSGTGMLILLWGLNGSDNIFVYSLTPPFLWNLVGYMRPVGAMLCLAGIVLFGMYRYNDRKADGVLEQSP